MSGSAFYWLLACEREPHHIPQRFPKWNLRAQKFSPASGVKEFVCYDGGLSWEGPHPPSQS